MSNYNLLSFIGGGILCVNMWPQIYKIWITKSSKDLSYLFIATNFIGLSFMCSYGILIKDVSLYIPTAFSIINTSVLCVTKIYLDDRYSYNDVVHVIDNI